ncbi:retrovirus-related pol polyprotein from transposon TNT 1-94, partial [Tanacetum coccineum]
MNHQTLTVSQVIPQVAYQSPQAPTQLMTESPFVNSGFVVPVFSPGDDPIAYLNKAMAFLTAVAFSSSKGNTTSGQARVVKCYNCQGKGHMARQCTQPKRLRNAAWYKEKAMLAEAQEARQILDEEQLAFLVDPGIPAGQAQIIIPHNAASRLRISIRQNVQDTNLQAQQDSMILSGDGTILSVEQAFWFHTLNPTIEPSYTPPVIVDVPSELPKVSLVNVSLKKLKFHLTQFDLVVKKRTTPNALVEGRTFTIVGNSCPLTRFTSTNVVPPKQTTSHSDEIQKLEIKVYNGQAVQTIIPNNAAFQTEDLDTYDSDCDDISNAKAVLIANISNYGSDVILEVVQIVLWYLDSGCSKHMTGNRSQLVNFVSKYLGTVRFGNDQIARIMGYDDYQLGNVTISRVYYVEGLGHNLFSVGQFCDADLEVAFRKNTCFVRNLEGVDLLSGSRDTNLYTISLDDMLKTSPICLLSKVSKTKSWLWHRRLSHLNF